MKHDPASIVSTMFVQTGNKESFCHATKAFPLSSHADILSSWMSGKKRR
jgi:hypothetical protein